MDTSQPTDLSHLEQQHRAYDQQLSELASKPFLSPEEELEETRLKKLKLHIKDQLNQLHRPSQRNVNHSAA